MLLDAVDCFKRRFFSMDTILANGLNAGEYSFYMISINLSVLKDVDLKIEMSHFVNHTDIFSMNILSSNVAFPAFS